MFVSVGPSGFTVSGLVTLGQAASKAFPDDFLKDGDLMARNVELGTVMIGVWLWGLVLWFFLVSVAANLEAVVKRTMHFSLGWWSFIFPNGQSLRASRTTL
jgi:tellurite resistance protein TehA-like permease